MSLVRAGLVVRAIRRAARLRQVDLAARAGVCQQTISNIERGRFGSLSVDVYLRVVAALGADVSLAPQWRGTLGARLLDRRHARLQQLVSAELLDAGWDVRSEMTFNYFGERGSVDVLGTRPATRAALIVEVKSELVSVEETLRILDMKRRVVPQVLTRDLGWRPESVGVVLVLPDGTTHRDAVARHAASLGRTLPTRTAAVRQWLAEPSKSLAGIWFLRDTTAERGTELVATPHRVRIRAGGPQGGVPPAR